MARATDPIPSRGPTSSSSRTAWAARTARFGCKPFRASFFFCHDRTGGLRAVICEVNNTFGERHHYLLANPDGRPIVPEDTLTARKVFHVSPFARVEGGYRFRFHAQGGKTLTRIEYFDAAGDLLHTSISGEAARYGARALAGAFVRYPWMTLGVIVRIHYQALRLLAH
jgi:DUF1365 family protein